MIDQMRWMLEGEIARAKMKHPTWPTDPIHVVAVVGEEAGEALKAALQWAYEGGTREALRTELLHTAATAIRALENFDTLEPAKDKRT